MIGADCGCKGSFLCCLQTYTEERKEIKGFSSFWDYTTIESAFQDSQDLALQVVQILGAVSAEFININVKKQINIISFMRKIPITCNIFNGLMIKEIIICIF